MVRQQISIILLGTLLVLTVSCASLQKDTLASTVDDGLSGDIADIAASIVPLDTSAGFAQVLDARKTIRDLEQKAIASFSLKENGRKPSGPFAGHKRLPPE